jgi:hypothetical protein
MAARTPVLPAPAELLWFWVLPIFALKTCMALVRSQKVRPKALSNREGQAVFLPTDLPPGGINAIFMP